MKDLTQKQQELVDFIMKFTRENNYQPTYAEMAKHIGVTKAAIHRRIECIQKKGYLQTAGRTRGLVLPAQTDWRSIVIERSTLLNKAKKTKADLKEIERLSSLIDSAAVAVGDETAA